MSDNVVLSGTPSRSSVTVDVIVFSASCKPTGST
jgi:hypothetical protein